MLNINLKTGAHLLLIYKLFKTFIHGIQILIKILWYFNKNIKFNSSNLPNLSEWGNKFLKKYQNYHYF